MRGKKKLVLGMAVLSTTGMLVFTATFPQPQIMQTEGTFHLTEKGTAGIMTEVIPDMQLDEILEQAVSIEKHDVITVAASVAREANTKADRVSESSKEKELDENKKVSNKKKANKDKKKNSDTEEKKSGSDEKALNKNTTKKTEAKEKNDASDHDSKEKASDKEKAEAKKASDEKNSDAKKTEAQEKNTVSEIKTMSTGSSEEKKDSDQQSAAGKKWENKLMADVDDYLNIRKAANTDSEIVGKLRKGDVATIIKKGETWTKIKSGSVKGYVKNKYCVYGTKAYKLANRICGTYATVQADGLRIRKNANKNATILEAAEEGDKLIVNTKAKDKDGWVTVKYNDKNAFVSEKYVDVSLVTGKAISIEEELEQIAAQQKAEAAAQASVASASSNSVTVENNAAQVSSSDLTLLSAIIYCEAGGESYAGQVAVGAVVMNRVRSSSYPNTISGVVYQSGQFSPVANGALARALSNGSYRNCTSAAQEALAGADNTGGAKFFHRVNGDAGLVIGNHVFY